MQAINFRGHIMNKTQLHNSTKTGRSGRRTAPKIRRIYGFCVSLDGKNLIVCSDDQCVRVYDTDGAFVHAIVAAPSVLNLPRCIVMNSFCQLIVMNVQSSGEHNLVCFDSLLPNASIMADAPVNFRTLKHPPPIAATILPQMILVNSNKVHIQFYGYAYLLLYIVLCCSSFFFF